jgi:hypothetical protein
MEKVWKEVYPGQKSARFIDAAMAIAIFISCMGLFGLVAFTACLPFDLHCFAYCLVFFTPLVAGLRLPCNDQLVDICSRRIRGDSNGVDHSQLSGY